MLRAALASVQKGHAAIVVPDRNSCEFIGLRAEKKATFDHSTMDSVKLTAVHFSTFFVDNYVEKIMEDRNLPGNGAPILRLLKA
jgi:hypothetical protein